MAGRGGDKVVGSPMPWRRQRCDRGLFGSTSPWSVRKVIEYQPFAAAPFAAGKTDRIPGLGCARSMLSVQW
jgi:hypothetical protein